MKTISKIKYVLFLLVIVGFISCKGEIGPIGPKGDDGTNGINGKDGNANVISSDWITPTWSATNSTYGEFNYSETRITEEFMNTGVLLSYIDWMGAGRYVYALPLTSGYGNTTFTINFGMTDTGSKFIKWFFQAASNFTPSANAKLRYIMIPSSNSKLVNSKQAIYNDLENAGVDINNYYEVMDYYGLDY